MSDYPATLGDLADVEARLEGVLEKLKARQASNTEVTDEKFAELRQKLASLQAWSELASGEMVRLSARVTELQKLWIVARENPELVRELAAQALKGHN